MNNNDKTHDSQVLERDTRVGCLHENRCRTLLDEIAKFLSPVLGTGKGFNTDTIGVAIYRGNLGLFSQRENEEDTASLIVQHTINLLDEICALKNALSEPENTYSPHDRRLLLALLDVLSLVGVYAQITPGLGIPLHRRTRLQFEHISSTQGAGEARINIGLLKNVYDFLLKLHNLETASEDVRTLQERSQPDLITVCAQLAFDPNFSIEGYQVQLHDILDSISTKSLLPILISLLHPKCPPWCRKPVLSYLSQVSTSRPTGVRDILECLIGTSLSNPTELANLDQAAQLLGSIPSTTTDLKQHYAELARQLIPLLDVPQTESTTGKAAAYVIGTIMQKKSGPMVKAFFPPLLDPIKPTREQVVLRIGSQTLVSESELWGAVQRLSLLVSYPNPTITLRLLEPVFVPLWVLYSFSVTSTRQIWAELSMGLLQTYLKISSDRSALVKLAENILVDGAKTWKYGHGDLGGIAVYARDATSTTPEPNPSTIDQKIGAFFKVVESADEPTISEYFFTILRKWLNGSLKNDDDPIGTYANLKVLATTMEKYGDKVLQKPTETLEIIRQILNDYVSQSKAKEESRRKLMEPSLLNLGSISSSHDLSIDEDLDIVAGCLSLLTMICSASDIDNDIAIKQDMLHDLYEALTFIAYSSVTDTSLSRTALDVLSMLNTQRLVPTRDADKHITTLLPHDDSEKYSSALQYIQDPLIPIRAQGLHMLQELISSQSPILDIPQTITLLVSMLQDEESFVYLNVIKCLTSLTDRHGKSVILALLSSYIDVEQKLSIDERLKIGEVMMRTIQRLGEVAGSDVVDDIAITMIKLGGRRNVRSKERLEVDTYRQRLKNEELDEDQKEYAEIMKSIEEEVGLESIDKHAQQELALQQEENWLSKDNEEDLRVRTSALSILGVLVEVKVSAMSSRMLSDALEMALHILILETMDNREPIRRAAIVLVMSFIKGVERKTDISLHVFEKDMQNLRSTLTYVLHTDKDGLVREQAAAVLEHLDK